MLVACRLAGQGDELLRNGWRSGWERTGGSQFQASVRPRSRQLSPRFQVGSRCCHIAMDDLADRPREVQAGAAELDPGFRTIG